MKARALILAFLLAAGASAEDRAAIPVPASGNVTLPLDEYNKLLELAAKPVKKPEAPPVGFALQRADLRFEAGTESVSGTVELDGEVYGKSPARVPLLSGFTIVDAQQKGRDLPLQMDNGVQTAVLGPGEFSLALSAMLPLSVEPGRTSFTLPVPSAGTVRLTLVIPGDRTNVNLSSGLITGQTSSGGRTTIEATLMAGRPATVWWATRENVAPSAPREVRFLSDVKTLVSVSEVQLAIAALAEITVVQGEPSQFEVQIPAGYEITGVSGSSLESSDVQSGVLVLKVAPASQRSHQFLISMERPVKDPKAEVPFLSFKGTQRETGEVLVESEGTVELGARESGGLKRMDLREISTYLRQLAHAPLQAAFRYHRQPTEPVGLALEWVRFPPAKVLAAVAQRAIVTTLVTSEGRSLTEVRLVLRNQAQPFLKVGLPPGASILSADVAGEKVKPVQGADGDRVPLLRPGFRPADAYNVSFVFLHAGTPFDRKGDSSLTLPKVDIPIGLMQWEVFLPEQFKVKDFGGDVIPVALLPPVAEDAAIDEGEASFREAESAALTGSVNIDSLQPGQLGGYILDASGATVARVRVTVVNPSTGTSLHTFTDNAGRWLVSNVPPGRIFVNAESSGFQNFRQALDYNASRPERLNFTLQVGSVSESVEVAANESRRDSARLEKKAKESAAAADTAASTNVQNLQRRVAGVLPIAVSVPHAGVSFRFVRPLVIDEETKVTFNYKTR